MAVPPIIADALAAMQDNIESLAENVSTVDGRLVENYEELTNEIAQNYEEVKKDIEALGKTMIFLKALS